MRCRGRSPFFPELFDPPLVRGFFKSCFGLRERWAGAVDDERASEPTAFYVYGQRRLRHRCPKKKPRDASRGPFVVQWSPFLAPNCSLGYLGRTIKWMHQLCGNTLQVLVESHR